MGVIKGATNFLRANPHLVPVVGYIRDHPGCTSAEISERLGSEVAPGDLQKLRDRGLIRRTGRTTAQKTRWSA